MRFVGGSSRNRVGIYFLQLVILLLAWPPHSRAATWTPLNHAAPSSAGTMMLLTDGTVMVLEGNAKNWMRLTPDINGSYINGTWSTTISPMSIPRLYFASNMLPSGKVFVLGGEYSGTALVANWSATGEIYDPVANTWSSITPYPSQSCGYINQYGGNITSGSNIVTAMDPPSTAGFQVGWTVTGTGIPAGTVIMSVASPSSIVLNNNATSTRSTALSLSTQNTGTVTTGSAIISSLSSTTGYQVGWSVSGAGIPFGATIASVDSLSQIHISTNATASGVAVALTFGIQYKASSCFGDDPTILLPNGKILAGDLISTASYLYDTVANSWSPASAKIYDRSDEEGWVLQSDGTVLTYDLFKAISTGNGYAEKYNYGTNTWSSISPADSSANGTLPVLSSNAVGYELGPVLRLLDDRAFVIGANGHTALYTPTTNTWAAGPDIMGTLGGAAFPFAADDASAAIMPNGHVLLAADAGLGLSSSGTTTTGSAIITAIPSTASLQPGWAVSGTGIPPGATILTVDSVSQVTISQSATATNIGVALTFGGVYSKPTQLFDFDPGTNAIAPVSPAIPDTVLNFVPSFVTRMLVLPTGQVLFSDSSNQLWIYTPDGAASPALLPTISQVVSHGGGLFTLTGTQLTGQSSGSSYGDDAESDENYPIVRLVNGSGQVYYARTTNWSYIGVGGGASPQTVDFKLSPATPPGAYSIIVSGAGISSNATAFVLVPDLTVSKQHTGNFIQGQIGATYTITVSNAGTMPTSGTVSVTDSLPAGLTATGVSGTGWSCTQPVGPCTRSDVLAAGSSYPAITLTVNVAISAPALVTNSATVAGGGESNTSNDTGTDPTTINPNPPLPAGVSPAFGSSLTQTFTFTFSAPNGWQSLGVVDVLMNNFLDGIGACYVAFVPTTSSAGFVFLVDDTGDAGGPFATTTLPSTGTVQNSQCSIAAAGSSVVGTGNTLTLTLAVTFKAPFAGNKVFYMAAQDTSSVSSGWHALGTWTVPGAAPSGPWVNAIAPARSTAAEQVFNVTFTDTNGFADISITDVLINNFLNGIGACYVAYVPSINTVILVDDAGDAGGPYAGAFVPGSGSASNSQCTVHGATSSVTHVGTTLTLTLDITFNSSFAGDRVIYAAAGSNTANSGWLAVGTESVP